MRDQGRLPPGTRVELLAATLLGALQGGLLLAQVRRDTTALEAGLDTVIAHIAQLAGTAQ